MEAVRWGRAGGALHARTVPLAMARAAMAAVNARPLCLIAIASQFLHSSPSPAALTGPRRYATQANKSTKNGSAGPVRASKVSTVEVIVPGDVAKERMRLLATGVWMEATNMKPLKRLAYLGSVWLRVRGVARDIAESYEQAIKIKRFVTVYLPYWCIDGTMKGKATGQKGRSADVHVFSRGSLLPAHDWTPLRAMPVTKSIPPLRALPKGERGVNVPKWKPFHPRQAESIDATVLPFTISPQSLAASLTRIAKQINPEDTECLFGLEKSLIRQTVKSFSLWISTLFYNPKKSSDDKKVVEHVTTMIKEVNEESTMRLEPLTLQVQSFCAQPILLPYHVAQVSHASETSSQQDVTIAMPGWEANSKSTVVSGGPSVGRTSPAKGQSGWYAPLQRRSANKFYKSLAQLIFYFSPRIPNRATWGSTNKMAREFADMKFEDGQSVLPDWGKKIVTQLNNNEGCMRQIANDSKSSLAISSIWAGHVSNWLHNFPIEPLKALEASAFEKSNRSAASQVPPEVEHGLGSTIDWNSAHYNAVGDDECKRARDYYGDLSAVSEVQNIVEGFKVYFDLEEDEAVKQFPEAKKWAAIRDELLQDIKKGEPVGLRWQHDPSKAG